MGEGGVKNGKKPHNIICEWPPRKGLLKFMDTHAYVISFVIMAKILRKKSFKIQILEGEKD